MGNIINRRRVCSGKELPYDAEVEYLMSDGNAYIDTGIYGKCNFEIQAGIPRVGSNISAIFGSRVGYHNNSFLILWGQDSRTDREGGIIRMDYWSNTFLLNRPSVNDVVITYNGSILTDGTNNIAISSSVLPTFGSHYLFAINSNNNIIKALDGTYIRKAKIGNLDLKPVRKNGIGYMYDNVSGQLFGNQGTGQFIIGPDKTA